MDITRIGDFSLLWGESLRWDDHRQRLYFVDCATQSLHWLDEGQPPLHSMVLPSMPAGLVLTDDARLVACLHDGLHVVDPDRGTSELLAPYPDGMRGRANDANADGAGNLVTGTLNMTVAPGAYWWFSATDGWQLLDDDISNANGPVVIDIDGQSTLIFADTGAQAVYAYPYDGAQGTVGPRRIFGDHATLDGAPDGAAADAEGAIWSCVLGSGKLARFTADGLDRTVDLPVRHPSDVAFGGPNFDRLFLVSIAVDLTGDSPPTPQDGWLHAIDGLGTGRPEAGFHLP